jgi:hypothetical protein
MTFQCPPAPALSPIAAAAACPTKFDQILRSAFQRAQKTPPFTAAAPITDKASWIALMALNTAAKIVVSPLFAGMVIPPSEPKETGGNDNTTAFGIPSYGGENPVKVDYIYTNLSPAQIVGLRKFSQESIPLLGSFALTNYWFNKNGDIIANQPKGYAADEYAGVPIYNHRLSTIGSEGLNADNKNNAGFYLPEAWDETVVMITADKLEWNPLFDL